MRVLPDTCIWSQALRRSDASSKHADELRRLIEDSQVGLIGPIRQEILSGIRQAAQAESLAERLRDFVDLPLDFDDYERAARYYTQARVNGVQGSNTDFLICSASVRYELSIYTEDDDFRRFSAFLPISLHDPAAA
ncbi:MAG: PIN domain nuclease [Gemmatimonadaceae bacterium]|nr:PIN domain nuclease [Gemmatimonadaceae bacterium]